jgi:hypothetical protein
LPDAPLIEVARRLTVTEIAANTCFCLRGNFLPDDLRGFSRLCSCDLFKWAQQHPPVETDLEVAIFSDLNSLSRAENEGRLCVTILPSTTSRLLK